MSARSQLANSSVEDRIVQMLRGGGADSTLVVTCCSERWEGPDRWVLHMAALHREECHPRRKRNLTQREQLARGRESQRKLREEGET